MNPFPAFGKMLIILGLFLLIIGILFLVLPKVPFLGRLPGDFVFRRGNFTFYFPLATSIIISVVLTIIFSLFRK